MPCILKQKTKTSPGIITFTNNEVLNGLPKKSQRVRDWLLESARNKEWLFGVHIQGDCSFLPKWPLEEWQNFVMWPDPTSNFVKNIPKEKYFDINCINFISDISPNHNQIKKWDICIVSRPSKIKRIFETLELVKEVMVLRPETKVLFIVPDTRDISKGERTYEKDEIDSRFFDLPMKIFSSKELQNICFLSPSTKSFGLYPVSNEIVLDSMRNSRFMMLTSHSEGVSRVVIESLLTGTPCIISKNLRSAILISLNKKNTLYLDDDTKKDAQAIISALNKYSQFSIDQSKLQHYKTKNNIDNLKNRFEKMINSAGLKVEGDWYLDNLLMRLPCHGVKHNFQFMNDADSFFYWLEKVSTGDPYNEDAFWREEKIKIDIAKIISRKFIMLKHNIKTKIKEAILSK